MSAAADPSWVLVVPVKRAEVAKSRLSDFAGDLRAELARAFAADCIAAAIGARGVSDVLVVTEDPPVGARARRLGCAVVPDLPAAGLNAAVAHGAQIARRRQPGCALAALLADLPALRTADLSEALTLAAPHRRAFVADADRVGTNLLTAGRGALLDPRFEGASGLAHRASGAVEIDAELASIRCDVDDAVRMGTAQSLGLGAATRDVVARIESGPLLEDRRPGRPRLR